MAVERLQHAGVVAAICFVASIPAANWLISNVGDCISSGPCLVPVGFGLMAPSGVYAIGFALVARDAVHEFLGWRVAMMLIVLGGSLSWWISPSLAVASGAAFLMAETADLLVYAPLRQRRLIMAVVLSGFIGAIVDSSAFLWLAFGSLDYLSGQVIGKFWASLAAVPLIYGFRRCYT